MSLIAKHDNDKLYAFQTIQEFVTSLYEYFGKKCHSISLYHRLVSNVTFSGKDLIDRHVTLFKQFLISNRHGIATKDFSVFNNSRLSFSDRIYIDFEYVFSNSDKETHSVVWDYLLLLSAVLDPASKAKEVLKEGNTKEGDFLSGMMDTIQSQVGDTEGQNPMALMGSLMNSDMFGTLAASLQGNIQDGKLDMAKLLGSMQGLVQKVGEEVSKSDDPMIKNMFSMLEQSLDKKNTPM